MRLAFVFCAFLALPALADEAKRGIDMTIVMTDVHGKAIPDVSMATKEDPTCTQCPALTLGEAIAVALLSEHPEERSLDAVEKARRGLLAQRIIDGAVKSLDASQRAKIIKMMSIWGPIVSAKALPLIDPDLDLTDKP